MAKEPRLIGSLQRAFDILDLFDHQTIEPGITEIACLTSESVGQCSGVN